MIPGKKGFPILKYLIPCLILLILSCTGFSQEQREFNRFQYHSFKWKVLHTQAFQLYYPRGYDSLASLASVQLPDIMGEVSHSMGVGLKDMPSIIIYPTIDQLYESNIGSRDHQTQTFPTINIKGSRMLLAFNGSYQEFTEQLKEAWVRLSWEQQFNQDISTQLSVKKQLYPNWYKDGCIHYVATGWSVKDETRFLGYFIPQTTDTTKQIHNFATLIAKDSTLTGQAFCYFIAHKYRADASKQILFQLRQGKSLSRAIRLVTKRTLDTLTNQCFHYYEQRFITAGIAQTIISDTLQPFLEQCYKGQIKELSYNADHSALYFVLEKSNDRKLFVTTIKDLKQSITHRRHLKPCTHYLMPPWYPEHNNDPYPLVRWQAGKTGKAANNGLDIIIPEKGKICLIQYDVSRREQNKYYLYGVDGVHSFEPWEKSQWLLSAYRRGRSDIVLYDGAKMRYTLLTADTADHTELALSNDKTTIAYRSGYPSDSLYHADSLNKDYGIYTKVLRGNFKEVAKERDHVEAKDSVYIHWYDPTFDATDAPEAAGTKTGMLKTVSLHKSKEVETALSATIPTAPWLKDYLDDLKKKDSIDRLLHANKDGEASFLKKVLSPGDTKAMAQMHRDSVRKALAYTYKKTGPYILQLYSAYFSAKINNDYFINRYQPFQAYLGAFSFPQVSAMLNGGFTDLFDNHHFNVGYSLPAGTEGSNFFATYENTAKKLDWHLMFFRKVESLQPDPQRDWKDNAGNPYPQAAKVKTHYYELGFHYPLHYDWSLDFTTAARRDRTIFLATDKYSLDYEALQSWWGIGSLALKVNKLKPTIPFLNKGFESKLLLDGMASTGKNSTMLYGAQFKFAFHQPIIRYITLVAQLQTGYSGGQNKILYNFGGLDNNIVPRVDTSVRFAQQVPYAFQSLVTPFRGYEQNSIYGRNYALLNLDLYFPLFQTLIPLHTSFSAINNLQMGLFTDMVKTGAATGLPKVNDHLTAYGFSARTMLAGYPIRFDMAWPGDLSKKPVWYLSLTIK